ncbi:MAG: hypothetical protein CO108_25645 [Deltaproteobacteria bacterium CG_4_9_14_3_um_filter_63_12]|nr:MAG: hypothetical protein CO108_25645 [Deltaproteobacteria bacterium CG_4_9_14_3_um_filter_63_12]
MNPIRLPSRLAELHLHLDGSLRRETLYELADGAGTEISGDVAFFVGMGLQGALNRFALTLSLLRSEAAIERVSFEICEDAAMTSVSTLEIRFAPQLHKGLSLEAAVDAACSGAEGRAGIILCGLYGESPEVLEALVRVGASREGVVGIDLAGGPMLGHKFSMTDYAPAFTAAREVGLGRTVHAGEGRPPHEIGVAIEKLHAQRIGHGTTLLEDRRILALVLERGVTIEACVTSNLHTSAIPSLEAHPLRLWLEEGVKVCICTDNTLFSDVDAPVEYARVAQAVGLTEEQLELCAQFGHDGAFGR